MSTTLKRTADAAVKANVGAGDGDGDDSLQQTRRRRSDVTGHCPTNIKNAGVGKVATPSSATAGGAADPSGRRVAADVAAEVNPDTISAPAAGEVGADSAIADTDDAHSPGSPVSTPVLASLPWTMAGPGSPSPAPDETALLFPSDFLEPFLAHPPAFRDTMARAAPPGDAARAGPAVMTAAHPADDRRGVVCQLQAATSPSQRLDEDTLTYLNQGQTYSIQLTGNQGRYRTLFAIRLLYGKNISALRPQGTDRSLVEMDNLASNRISDVKKISPEGGLAFSWESTSSTRESAILAFRVNCLSTDFSTHRRGEKGAFLQLEVTTAVKDHIHSTGVYVAVDVSTCLIKVFKGGAERRLKQDNDKVLKALADTKGQPQVRYQGSQVQTTLGHAKSLQDLEIDMSLFKLAEVELKMEPGASDLSQRSRQPPHFSSFLADRSDHDEEHSGMRRTARPRVALKITESSPVWDVQSWLTENHFADSKTALKNYNGRLMLSLEKCDFVQICGTAEGIRMFTTLHLGRESSDATPASLSVTTYTQTD